jgi:hypothetical protein
MSKVSGSNNSYNQPIRRGYKPGFVNYKKGRTRLAVACAKVYQLLAHAHGRWFSPDTPASSFTKTGRHDIAEIFLKVMLNHHKSINQSNHWDTSTTHKTSEHERGTIKLWTAELLNLSDYRTVGLSNYRNIELSDYRAVGPSNRRTIELELSDHRTVGLSDHRTVGLSIGPHFFLYIKVKKNLYIFCVYLIGIIHRFYR